jgi:hypothetical protein
MARKPKQTLQEKMDAYTVRHINLPSEKERWERLVRGIERLELMKKLGQ